MEHHLSVGVYIFLAVFMEVNNVCVCVIGGALCANLPHVHMCLNWHTLLSVRLSETCVCVLNHNRALM